MPSLDTLEYNLWYRITLQVYCLSNVRLIRKGSADLLALANRKLKSLVRSLSASGPNCATSGRSDF